MFRYATNYRSVRRLLHTETETLMNFIKEELQAQGNQIRSQSNHQTEIAKEIGRKLEKSDLGISVGLNGAIVFGASYLQSGHRLEVVETKLTELETKTTDVAIGLDKITDALKELAISMKKCK